MGPRICQRCRWLNGPSVQPVAEYHSAKTQSHLISRTSLTLAINWATYFLDKSGVASFWWVLMSVLSWHFLNRELAVLFTHRHVTQIGMPLSGVTCILFLMQSSSLGSFSKWNLITLYFAPWELYQKQSGRKHKRTPSKLQKTWLSINTRRHLRTGADTQNGLNTGL